MKNKKIVLIGIGILIICLISVLIEKTINKNKEGKDQEVKEGYIAVFHGGAGEITDETYIYKQDNNEANRGFDYINTTSTTTSWGSPMWESKVTKKGSVEWTDEVFTIAKKNNAYSYVTLPNSEKIYSIEEYQNMFLMN